jgi:hypothetical protein
VNINILTKLHKENMKVTIKMMSLGSVVLYVSFVVIRREHEAQVSIILQGHSDLRMRISVKKM